jgi:hypothetical protein
MPKESGMGDQLYVGGYDLGASINSVQRISGGPYNPIPMTAITQSAMAREGGQRDGGIDCVSYFDPAAGANHERFSALPTTDVVVTYGHGTTLGGWSASCVAKQVGYDGDRGQDGSFLLTVNAVANGYGLEWGRQLTAGKRTDGSATNGSSLDLGSASPGAFGLQMWVHLFAFTGTSVTIKIQESSDNGSGDAFADVTGASTGALTGITAMRVATGAIDVERYLRVVTTGTFSDAVFFVQAIRNATTVSF